MTDERLLKAVGRKVRELRVKAGLTEEDMMSHGFERRYYQRIEAGQVNISIKSINKLAKMFKVDVWRVIKVD